MFKINHKKGAVMASVNFIIRVCAALAFGVGGAASAQTTTTGDAKQPNILVLMGDDIGIFNISAYNNGMMRYTTPNIDSIAADGALFTDWYGEQSCTAGRAAFITGQAPIRTGLLKVGMPGSDLGINTADPTLGTLLQSHGYVTGQFGKNHLGDRNEFLPTVNGFDEWMGNLYHLNAEEEPEYPDYPKDPAFRAKYGPRGVLHCYATNEDDPTVDPRFGKVGKQKCEDTGPLTRKRMETVDVEVTAATIKFMDTAVADDKPFFIWWNSSRMHGRTHLKPESDGKTGLGIYADGMVETDGQVGELLAEVERLGIEDNTIVIYTTDNGAMVYPWPDGGTTIFRGEKNTQWEGGYRVPALIKWPGVIAPGTKNNEIVSHQDMLPTLLAAAGDTTVKDDLLVGRAVGETTYKVHLDGYNLLPALKGDEPWPRHEFLYWTDGGDLAALRFDDMKISWLRQNSKGQKVWETQFEQLRLPMLTNLRMDPFERAVDESPNFDNWAAERLFFFAPATEYVARWVSSFREFPPRAKPGTFGIEQVMEAMMSAPGAKQ